MNSLIVNKRPLITSIFCLVIASLYSEYYYLANIVILSFFASLNTKQNVIIDIHHPINYVLRTLLYSIRNFKVFRISKIRNLHRYNTRHKWKAKRMNSFKIFCYFVVSFSTSLKPIKATTTTSLIYCIHIFSADGSRRAQNLAAKVGLQN